MCVCVSVRNGLNTDMDGESWRLAGWFRGFLGDCQNALIEVSLFVCYASIKLIEQLSLIGFA